MEALDTSPGAEVTVTVGAAGVGSNVVGRGHRAVHGGEVGTMAGDAGVRVIEACVKLAMTKGQTRGLQRVIAGGWGIVAISTFGEMGLGNRVDAGAGMADAGDTTC